MLNAKRGTALFLVLAFLFIVGFSVPSQADDPGAVVKPFMDKLLSGRSPWSLLTKQSQEAMVQLAMASAAEEESLKEIDKKDLEAYVRHELADENSELSQALWQEIKKEFTGVTADDVTVKSVKVNGNSAVATLKDDSPLKLFKEDGVWKVGLMETGMDE